VARREGKREKAPEAARRPNRSFGGWSETDGLVFDLGSSIGVLRPIRLDAVCATCHGTALEPTLAAELTRRYPADKATGFTSLRVSARNGTPDGRAASKWD
jgi:hypothetical protein